MNVTDEEFWFLVGLLAGFAVATWVIPHKYRKVIASVATTVAALLTLALAVAGRAANS